MYLKKKDHRLSIRRFYPGASGVREQVNLPSNRQTDRFTAGIAGTVQLLMHLRSVRLSGCLIRFRGPAGSGTKKPA
jgi:hypothetical protein